METKKLPKDIYKLLVNKMKYYKYMQEDILDIEADVFKTDTDINSGIKSKYKKNDSVINAISKLEENKEYQELKAWQKVIGDLLEVYLSDPVKIKFIKRRYIDCELAHYKIKGKLKDIDVVKDLECEGYSYSEITWKRWKYEIMYKLYELAKEDKLLKKLEIFNQ